MLYVHGQENVPQIHGQEWLELMELMVMTV
jgi:hypothetical protein